MADVGSFTRAAEHLHVAQPSLSHQIRVLEQELGGPLLERGRGTITPTPAGNALLPGARLALNAASSAVRMARAANRSAGGVLHLATHSSIACGVIPDVNRRWNVRHPSVQLMVSEFPGWVELEEAARAGAGDLAVGAAPSRWKGPVTELGYEEFVLLLPPGDPAAPRDPRQVDIAELADRRWVLYTPDHGATGVVDSACARAGFAPVAITRTGHVAAVVQLVSAGLGPALVPRHALPPGITATAHPIAPRVLRRITAYTRGDRVPIIQELIDAIGEEESWLSDPPIDATIAP